jgi:Uma2 family endonuclease
MTTVTQWIEQAPEAVRERFELIRGRWKEREVAGRDHQHYGRLLANELERRGLQAEDGWRVVLPTGDHPAPDVVVVSRANPDQPGPASYFGVPDLVVEILAADNDDGEDVIKKAQYAAAGVRHYWLVRLKGMTVEPQRLGGDGEYHAACAPPVLALLPLTALPVPPDLS